MMTMLMALLVPLPRARNAVVPAPHLVVMMMMMMNHCSWMMMMMIVVATVLLEVKPRLPRLRRLPLTKLCPSCHAFSV